MCEVQEVNGPCDRELKAGQYAISTFKDGEMVGQIICSRSGLKLIDFYRTGGILAKDVPKKEKP